MTPTFEEHFASFTRLFTSVERSILKNPKINEFYEQINEMFFLRSVNKSGQVIYYPWAEQVSRISMEHLEVEYHKLDIDFEKWKPKNELENSKESKNKDLEDPPRDFQSRILSRVKNDIGDGREFVANFYETQEIHDFAEEWKKRINSITPEMNFYKDTWEKVKVHEKL